MSDVLGYEPPARRWWIWPVLLIPAAFVVIALASRPTEPPPRGMAPSPSPTSTPRLASPLPSPVLAGSACGGEVAQPLIDADPLPADTGLQILIGGRDLRLVDVDAGTTKVLAMPSDRGSFTDLVQTAATVAAVLSNPCGAGGYGNGLVAAVDPANGELSDVQPGDAVLPGEPPTVLDYDSKGAAVVRELGSRSSTRVPAGWGLYARTTNGYFASVSRSGDAAADLGVGSIASARLTTAIGSGPVVAASPELLFWLAGDCPGAVHCLLTWTTVEGTNTALPIDTNAWGGVVSPDGTKMAFRKARASGRLGSHPGPPNDVAVLVTSGRLAPLRVLPGLVLSAKAGLTLTWSPDSEWLVIGADLGTGPAILVWRQGMDRPARVPIPPTGGGTTGPPALLVLPR